MSMMEFLREITAVPGTSGYESPVAQAFYEAFAPFADEISIDPMGSVVAVQRGTGAGPRLLLTAHIDEVGLMTTDVEEDGSVRFMPMGVAAFPSPRKLAQILALSSCFRSSFRFAEGKTRHRSGEKTRARSWVIPALSIRRPTPDHRHRLPAMEMPRVIPDWAPSRSAPARAGAL